MRQTMHFKKQRTTDPELLAAHERAWKALKALPIYQEIDALHAKLSELQTWQPETQSLEEHTARYEAGKPQELRAKIRQLTAEMHKTPENQTWFELYNKIDA